MKLVLLLAAGALAAQDTTPPTISLDLSAYSVKALNGDYQAGDRHITSAHTGRANGFHRDGLSATCEVSSNAADAADDVCPMPKCKAVDHHDVYCKAGVSACADLEGEALYNHCMVAGEGTATRTISDDCTHEFECVETYTMIDDDNHVLTEEQKDATTFTRVHREVRSEWIIHFNAEDRTGNKAETVSFAMVFRDTLAPELSTEFGDSDLWQVPRETSGDNAGSFVDTKTVRSPKDAASADVRKDFAEACVQGIDIDAAYTTPDFDAHRSADPCTKVLDRDGTVEATDRYDGDVTAAVEFRMAAPGATLPAFKLLEGSPSTPPPVTDAELTIDTHELGLWQIEYRATDKAQQFGYNQASNSGVQSLQLTVTDNIRPIMSPITFPKAGTTPAAPVTATTAQEITIECNRAESAYNAETETGAKCHDTRNTWNAETGQYVDTNQAPETTDLDNIVAQGKVINAVEADNKHFITYNCDDGDGGNHATYADRDDTAPTEGSAGGLFRTVVVVDTRPPVLNLVGDRVIQNSAGKNVHVDNAAKAESDAFHATNNPTFEETKEAGGGLMVGSGAGQLGCDSEGVCGGAQCTDSCDATPFITAKLFSDRSCGADGGALVTGDAAAGELSNWESGGWEYKAGDYSILYTCTDNMHNSVHQNPVEQCRFIDNVDHTRPIIQILGADDMTLEATHAGNYVDDGATCSDGVDGVISQNVEVSGDVVNLSKIGTYHIVYNCRDSAGNAADQGERVVHIAQTACPECTVSCPLCPSCAADRCTQQHEASFVYTDAGVTCSDAIDGTIMRAADLEDNSADVDAYATGTYVVTYRARNSAGLWSDGPKCKNTKVDGVGNLYLRTVNVVDTLKPVIQVSYAGTPVAHSNAHDTAVHNQAPNPANHPDNGFPLLDDETQADRENELHKTWPSASSGASLMAEAATRNAGAWALAGVAAAVAGVALLASSQRRAAVTAVPV